MTSFFSHINKDSDEDNSMRLVLDIACIDSSAERKNRFNLIQKEYDTLLSHAESLIDDNKNKVKELLSTFTKIVMRIKDSREKLKNLKTRLRVCKNTFSASFERTESESHFFIRTKECVSLMKKVSFVVDASKSINSFVSNKSFLSAALLIQKVNNYLTVDLEEIDAVVNIRLDIENQIYNLFDAILNELNLRLYDNIMLKNKRNSLGSIFLKLFNFPITKKKTIYDSWSLPYEEQFDELIEGLKVLRKLKIGLNMIIKSFDIHIVKIFEDVVTSTHEEILEELGLSKSQNHTAIYDKKNFFFLLCNILQRLDCIHQKGLFLVSIFSQKLKEYDGEINEIKDDSSESNTELLDFSMHHSINKHLKLFVESYLVIDEDIDNITISDSTLSTRTLQQVFSLRQRLSNTSNRSHIYRFSTGQNTSHENTASFGSFILSDSCMNNICVPSIKYFKHIYLPLKIFTFLIGSFYTSRNLENPFESFIEKFYLEKYSIYFQRKLKKLINFEFSGSLISYGISSSKSDPFMTQYKLLNDFDSSQSKILRHMSYFPNHYFDFVKRFEETFYIIKTVFTTTLNDISVANGITVMAFQVYNSIPPELSHKIIQIYQDKSLNQTLDENAYFLSLESLIASPIENIKILQSHTMNNPNLETLIDLFHSSNMISKILQSYSDIISSYKNQISQNYSRNSDSEYIFIKIIFDEIPKTELEQINTQIKENCNQANEFYAKCFAIIYFEIRFHITYFMQSIIKNKKSSSDQLDQNTNGLLNYLLYLKEIITSKICSRAYKFMTQNIFHYIKEYIFILIKNDSEFTTWISDVKRFVSILQIDFLNESQQFTESFPFPLFIDHLFLNSEQIITSIIENGPKFDFETYNKILIAVKEPSVSNDLFNRRLKDVQKLMLEAASRKDESE